MEIKTSQLSKKTLVGIVERIRPSMLSDEVMAAFLRADMIDQVRHLFKKQEKLGKKIDRQSPKITLRSSQKKIVAHNDMIVAYNKMNKKGDALLDLIKEIEKEYPAVLTMNSK